MLLVLIRYVIENIRKSIVYIALSINICKAKSLYTNISKI